MQRTHDPPLPAGRHGVRTTTPADPKPPIRIFSGQTEQGSNKALGICSGSDSLRAAASCATPRRATPRRPSRSGRSSPGRPSAASRGRRAPGPTFRRHSMRGSRACPPRRPTCRPEPQAACSTCCFRPFGAVGRSSCRRGRAATGAQCSRRPICRRWPRCHASCSRPIRLYKTAKETRTYRRPSYTMQVPAGAHSGIAPAARPPSAASSTDGWRPLRWLPGTTCVLRPTLPTLELCMLRAVIENQRSV